MRLSDEVIKRLKDKTVRRYKHQEDQEWTE